MKGCWIILCLLLILTSCKREVRDLIGTWVYERPALPKLGVMVYLKNTAVYFGDTLVLASDSTFRRSGCTIMSGPYERVGDTLILHVQNHEWAVDSLQRTGYNGEWPEAGYTQKLIIKNGKVIKHDKDVLLLSKEEHGQVDTLNYARSYEEFNRVGP